MTYKVAGTQLKTEANSGVYFRSSSSCNAIGRKQWREEDLRGKENNRFLVACSRLSKSLFRSVCTLVGWSVHHTPWNTIIAKRSFNLCYCPCPPKRDWSCPVYVVYVIESLTTWRIWRWWITGLAGSTWFDWFSSMTPKMQRSGYFETSSSLNGKLYRSMLRE